MKQIAVQKALSENEFPRLEQIEQELRIKIEARTAEADEYRECIERIDFEEEKEGKLTPEQLKARIKFTLRLSGREESVKALAEVHNLFFKQWQTQQQ